VSVLVNCTRYPRGNDLGEAVRNKRLRDLHRANQSLVVFVMQKSDTEPLVCHSPLLVAPGFMHTLDAPKIWLESCSTRMVDCSVQR
jgi:hypothetical protein